MEPSGFNSEFPIVRVAEKAEEPAEVLLYLQGIELA